MAQIGREPGKHPMEIAAFAIPPLKAMNGHGVTQIVKSRADTTGGGFEAAAAKEHPEVMGDVLNLPRPAIFSRENESIRAEIGRAVLLQPATQSACEVAMERHPANPALAWSHPETGFTQIKVPAPNPERFADTQPCAVKHDDQKPIAAPGSRRAVNTRSLFDYPPDLPVGKDMGKEARFGRLWRPAAIRDEGAGIVAPAKLAELP